MRVHPFAPVVALDIDGTLADYHGHFKKFAEMYLGEKLPLNWEGKQGDFSSALGIERHVYRDIKLAYRQGGQKRSIPFYDGAGALVREIRDSGYAVWICTTRPYLRLDNIDPDTRESFRRNSIEPDGLIYGEHKYADLVDIVGLNRIVCAVEDMPDQFLEGSELGIRMFLASRPHNKWFLPNAPDGVKVGNLTAMRRAVFNSIEARENR